MITSHPAAIDRRFVALYVKAHATTPREIIFDLDATDDPVHRAQRGRFFHGHYGQYCYLPLYTFAASTACFRLRLADDDASAAATEEVARIVSQLRAVWRAVRPAVRIIVRAGSGFRRDPLLRWCETHAVDFVIGPAKNTRLTERVADDLAATWMQCVETDAPSRAFAQLTNQSFDSRS